MDVGNLAPCELSSKLLKGGVTIIGVIRGILEF